MDLNEKSDALAAESTRSVAVYYSYAPEDERWQKELEKQLSGLKRKGLIVDWHKRRISAGLEKAGEIDAHLNTAAIILLLEARGDDQHTNPKRQRGPRSRFGLI